MLETMIVWQADEPKGRQDPGTKARPSHPLTPRRLRVVFLDLVGRPPYEAERERWAGGSLRALLTELLGSEEAWEHWLEEQFYFFLLIDNFRPRSERVLQLVPELAEGRADVREAIHTIALSSSFDQRNPGADTFVTVVMEQLNGIEVQNKRRELEVGKAIYDGGRGKFLGKTGETQADIVRIAVEHKSFTQTFLTREYLRICREEPERKELLAWSREFDRDPRDFVPMLERWFTSEAHGRRLGKRFGQPNRIFVRSLFVDLFDRLPEIEEQRRLRGALDGLSDPGPLRSVLARLLLDSGQVEIPDKKDIQDPTAWVRSLFERLLGREAEEAELRLFVTTFHQKACEPSTILYALLSDPEYSKY